MQGRLPAIVQDADTLDVLMLAYVSPEALDLTRSTGQAHYFSRSRGRLWRKGEESGNVQHVRNLTLDCDGDALLLGVRQEGVVCHTGKATCFHHPLLGQPPALQQLWRTITERKAKPEGYTGKLLADENLRLKKLAEEAGEAIMAVKDRDRAHAVREFADLQYHMWVAMAAMDISPGDVAEELAKRAQA
ncbi:MAG: bifunctional phosphoribosyl-AMP cyclohydrolase/phosphoribosyl-ATP diphosphatase HisIE [Halobacteriales archaeon]|nr:bifunctional phosphoribosyl-AMP cyclohydrolase/phosphoribosyl-ATP diphosphatase HisIE [Halobacteriales archaeon]